ncbi:MAG: hypothetical protein V3U37_04780 [Nitrospinaceae bacterium]
MQFNNTEETQSPFDLTDSDRITLIKDFEKSLHEENLRLMSEFYGVEFIEALDNFRKTA